MNLIFIFLVFAGSIISNFESKWEKITSLEISFKQKVISKHLETEDISEGIIYIKNPDKIRWVSNTDNTVMIVNGQKLTVIKKSRRGKVTVEIYEKASSYMDTKFLDFLSGKARISEVYKTKVLSESENDAEVELINKRTKEKLIAKINKKNFLVSSLMFETSEAKNLLEFLNTKINPKLNDSLFIYIPKATDSIYKK